jgi:hypothetical protein
LNETATAGPQHAICVRLRGLPRRDDTEHKDGHDSHGDEGDEHRSVDLVFEPIRQRVRRYRRFECAYTDKRNSEAEKAANGRDDRTFYEQLADDAKARGAERHPHCDFARPIDRAGEHQIGDVGRGENQREKSEAHERKPRRIGQTSQNALVDRHDARVIVPARFRELTREARNNRFDFGTRVGCADTLVQPAENTQLPRCSGLRGEVWQR